MNDRALQQYFADVCSQIVQRELRLRWGIIPDEVRAVEEVKRILRDQHEAD